MFFQIKPDIDNTFPTHIKLTDHLWLNADAGWKEYQLGRIKVVFKGYIDSSPVTVNVLQEIADSPTPALYGNFIALVIKYNSITIQHDVFRSFPLLIDGNKCIHNMDLPFTYRVPSSGIVTVFDNLTYDYTWFDPIGEIDHSPLTKVDAITAIDQILTDRFVAFFEHNTLPVNIYVSGGIDTITCWSYIKKLGIEYNLISAEHIANSHFMQHHNNDISGFWGYKQIHSWEDPSILVSGALGDEILFRGPKTGNMLLNYLGTSYPEVLNDTHYHHYHHNKPQNVQHYSSFLPVGQQEVIDKILRITVNDHQHWHLDNTLTFTPYKDIRLIKILLQLSLDDIVGQLVDAEINKALVAKNYPTLLRHLSRYKNKLKHEDINFNSFLEDK